MSDMVLRDESKKLLVIGGPCDGQRMARPGDEFTEIIGTGKIIEKRAKFKYLLRWHPVIKVLVWALPENKSVHYPSKENIQKCG
ncbi:hypothetical protein [Pseudomonas syringae group genomosp. 3]|uniref:Uncharacterized protein n=1 Tax=Pseudomonas syringae pv. coriandricola TaxID=264453 RepID=A0A3M3JT06_9PSED|nr:hypothetical protein [Pseudomonas syringae group genomosp. 3]RMN13959.1 hypothetical protein ALQ65_200276 [Pseudomonas syringae pv. coriandricola]